MEIREHVPLARYTTFEIGGNARWYVEVTTTEEIVEALLWARDNNVRFYIIAGGSNLLIADEGLPGIVIRIAAGMFGITSTTLEAAAGCNLLDLIRLSASEGLSGWEKMAGIPGSIGGAVRGNAGAFGTEIKNVLTWAQAINIDTLEQHEFSDAECGFGYRTSYFKLHPQWIITRVHLSLGQGDALATERLIEETIAEREKRHIQNVRAAGSYFLNPAASLDVVAQFEKEKGTTSRENRVPAGWLIEKAGMKGKKLGGVQSSPQQANYLVNIGDATASDVRALADLIKTAVREQFNIELQEEAVILK